MIYKLIGATKNYVWGGTKLATEWGKKSQSANIAESWELSFHPDGPSIIDGGKYNGIELADVVTKEEWGKNCSDFPFFPTLNKFIDAKSNLSVQVHPSDDYALSHEGQYGKTEMWHVLDAEPNACLYLGLNRALTASQFAQAAEDGTIMQYLNAVPVHKGETYFIPSGTLHAIGKGITLFEIQQNSSLTYRVYDYGRLGLDGKPRQLHVEKAKAVTNLDKYIVPSPKRDLLLGKCKYFAVYRHTGAMSYCFADSFTSVTVTDGAITICGEHYAKGETCFASAGEPLLIDGDGLYILTRVEK